jgi:hypothetical protein
MDVLPYIMDVSPYIGFTLFWLYLMMLHLEELGESKPKSGAS